MSRFELESPALRTELRPSATLAELRSTVSYTELPTTEVRSDRYFIARKDWQGTNSNSLNLVRGDLVKIVQMTHDGKHFAKYAFSDVS